MESQGKQPPTKDKWWQRLQWAIKKNKNDALEEFPLSVRFIIKYIAFTLHHAHKPTQDFSLNLAFKDREFSLLIPLHYLDFVHKFILVILVIYIIRLIWDTVKTGWKRISNTIKDIRD